MTIAELFDFEATGMGARMVLQTEPDFRFPSCMSDAEIDANVKALKEQIDHVVARMKKALAEAQAKPDFPDEP